jgi:hypothetical protein
MADAITRLFRVCAPNEPVAPDDPRWVNCDDVRGENLARLYARALRRADPNRPEVKVFAGHRGVGKTSELLRLKSFLEKPHDPDQKPFLVILSDVSRSLDLNDLDFPDLLVFQAAEIQRQLREAQIPSFSATNEYLTRLWDDFKDLLSSEVSVTGGEVGALYGKLALELKNRPNSRAELRKTIERQSTGLLAAVNDLLDLATVRLRQSGREGLVLIIDGLDKLTYRELDHSGTSTHDRLFIQRSEQLASLKAHVVYTVPISLIYSPQFTQLEQTFGGHHVPVPMIRLHEKDDFEPAGTTPGLAKLREILEARCRHANVVLGDVFDDEETCRRLCEMTGGHPRHLMMFIQAAANEVDTFPITGDAVDKAVRNYANSLLREVPNEFWPHLRKFDTPQADIPKDEIHQQMLLLLHVFEYMNGEPWYEVNPVLRTLPKFHA